MFVNNKIMCEEKKNLPTAQKTSLGPFIHHLLVVSPLSSSRHSVVVLFALVAVLVLSFSRRFVVARIPTPRAVARGGGWGCFCGPV
jgi:hypothetical protein